MRGTTSLCLARTLERLRVLFAPPRLRRGSPPRRMCHFLRRFSMAGVEQAFEFRYVYGGLSSVSFQIVRY